MAAARSLAATLFARSPPFLNDGGGRPPWEGGMPNGISRYRRTELLLGALGCIVSTTSGAQTGDSTSRRSSHALTPIVVTATRVTVPAVTAATTVILGSTLREQGITHVLDAIRA